MSAVGCPSYKYGMNPTHATSSPHFTVAGLVLEALAAHDFEMLTDAFEDSVSLAGLLPGGFRTWEGAADVCAAFERWFGDVDAFEVVDASVGQVGALLQLRWRVRVQGARFGGEPMVAEQHVYAATGPNSRIQRMSLLCSGFWNDDIGS
jgi:hypothetical protein